MFKVLLLILGLNVLSYADSTRILTPVGTSGEDVHDSSLGGASYTLVQGTAVITTTPTLFYGYIASTGAVSVPLGGFTFYDSSATSNNLPASTRVTPRLYAESTTLPTFRIFTTPIRTRVGLSVEVPFGGTESVTLTVITSSYTTMNR